MVCMIELSSRIKSRPAVLTEPGHPLMSHNVNSQTMCGLSKYQSEAAKELIRMTFYCHGHPITAVIYTGSEITSGKTIFSQGCLLTN